MNRQLHVKAMAATWAIVWLALGGVQAQIVSPTYIGNQTPKTNQLGRNVPGTIDNPDGTAVWVEIREVGSAIRPPDPVTGEGNEAFNPLLRASYMGHDVSVGQNTGLFSETLTTNRLKDGSNYFVRVYDKGTPSASLYYANSVAFQDVPPEQRNQVALINVVFQGWNLVNGEEDVDSDGDGIPDAMEMDMGFDPNDADMDDDGYDDLFEVQHSDYLNAKEGDPNEIQMQAETVNWWAIPDVGYRLEYTDAMLDPEAFVEIWSGTATQTNLEVNVEAWVTNGGKGFFRWAVP